MSSEETNARKTSPEPPGLGDTSGSGEHQPDLVRRALIHAGWSIPIVLALRLPTNAFAQYQHADLSHTDSFADVHTDHQDHIDLPHFDIHSDHLDICLLHGDHGDLFLPHIDTCLQHGDIG